MVTSGKPGRPGRGSFNLSSVPTSSLSAKWKAVVAAWDVNVITEPVDAISVAVCSPRYFIEPWIIDFVNGSMVPVQRLSQIVGNLDPRQLNISIQDCFNFLPQAPPILPGFGLPFGDSEMLFPLLFNATNNVSSYVPLPSGYLTTSINNAIPDFVQPYLDNFPYGEINPPDSKLLIPALVLSAELKFICATAALYIVLSAILFHLFTRPAAERFTIRSVLSVTRQASTAPTTEVFRGSDVAANIEQISSMGQELDDSAARTASAPHTTDKSRGQDVAAMIEEISTAGCDGDDAERAAQINKSIGDYYTIVHEDPTTHHMLLEIDSKQHVAAPNLLLECYENVRAHMSRIAWAFTPALGATLVAFGIAASRYPHVVSRSPQGSSATFFSALFTWGLGVWRSLSLFAITNLIQQANSDVSILDDKLIMFMA